MPLVVRRTVGLLASAALAVLGCEKAPPPGPAPTAASPAASAGEAAASASAADAGPARKLALADPGGSGALDREITALQRTAERVEGRTDPWILLGRAWVRKARATADPGFYLNASACADVALGIDPRDRAAMNLRGFVLLNDHKFAAARDLAEEVLTRDAEDVMALGTLSDAHLELGRFDEAASAAQRMVDLKPSLPSYARASHVRWLQGDTAAAKKIVRLAIDAGDPRDPEPVAWVLVQAAMIFWHEGDYDGADKGFEQALARVGGYPPALVGRGRVAMAKGDWKRAAELFERSFKESPLAETAWLLGDARAAAGDAAGAAEAYGKVEKIGRQSDRRTLALYWATRDLERDEAVKLAEAERAIRDDIYTEDTLAWALHRAGKPAEARAAIDKALALGTRDARLLYHAGAVRIAGGDKAGGEKLVREALKLNPKFDQTGAAEAARLVEGSGGAARPGP